MTVTKLRFLNSKPWAAGRSADIKERVLIET